MKKVYIAFAVLLVFNVIQFGIIPKDFIQSKNLGDLRSVLFILSILGFAFFSMHHILTDQTPPQTVTFERFFLDGNNFSIWVETPEEANNVIQFYGDKILSFKERTFTRELPNSYLCFAESGADGDLNLGEYLKITKVKTYSS